MTKPTVSLLIPAYNAESWLSDLLTDAANQTLPFAEIVVYDDASTDQTSEAAARFAVKVIRGEINRGAGYARNQLISASTSPWIHFHDADDRLSPNFNEKMLREVEIGHPASNLI